jgi:putative mRNA 3-end processing factor
MSEDAPLLRLDDRGLYCEAGDFHIDPWRPVARAVISHAHGDHARPGSASYLAAEPGVPLLQRRLGRPEEPARIQGIPYGQRVKVGNVGNVEISFHPAGHVLGSSQIRVEHAGDVWVFSGDYKRQADPTCEPFEPVRCRTFITEATFALPIYRWDDPAVVARGVLDWWDEGREQGRASVLFAYSLGKAQRLMAELALLTGDRTVWTHGAVESLTEVYRQAGVRMLPTRPVADKPRGESFAGELVIAPPSAAGSTWMRRFGAASTGFASGWMRVRGTRRRRGVDRGFVLSDHADWPELLRTIGETGAERVLTTHGFAEPLARFLREHGLEAGVLLAPFEGESFEGESD